MTAFIQHDIPLEVEVASHAPRVLDRAGRPKKRRATPERSVQVTIKHHLETIIPGCEPVAITNEQKAQSSNGFSQSRFHERRKAAGGVWGATDLMVICPGGVVFFVEVKAPGGRVEARQAELHERWRAKGQKVIVADSVEALRRGLRVCGIRTIEAPGQQETLPRVYYEGIPAGVARARGLIA